MEEVVLFQKMSYKTKKMESRSNLEISRNKMLLRRMKNKKVRMIVDQI